MAKSLQELLTSVLPQQQQDWKLYLLDQWSTIIGNLSSRMRLEKIQDDTTLIVGVYDSHWMQELYFLSPLIINTINAKLDQPRIKQLRFKHSPYKASVQHTTEQPQSPIIPMIKRILTLSEQQALATIDDPQLRKALEQFLMRCYREK